MHVFLFFLIAACTAFQITYAASDCKACQLDEHFSDANGYSCFHLNNGKVACTCPDQRYTLDKPCRICDRANICGDNPSNLCSEISATVPAAQDNAKTNFGCFCVDMSFYFGEPCPSSPVTSTTTTGFSATTPILTTTRLPLATTILTTTRVPLATTILTTTRLPLSTTA
ncbi:unnamed protein product [Rotaria socialis]|uniref:Uncharacterized protein n=1 Tax=Rotaria socialis TaxID=392032 RepID=A0A820S441_9BILA|nr:unnamed protein product [Rotaria socialis]CAF3373677.1 unnamed protein product [Rotaria socialis]CAF3424284.1 unnamed protein product [Rotaria socialis]CAF3515598.1 unnamed protein product [Rotaria socialis]CAF4163834.1 unnamed protein product [Rotaria socialis]